MDQESRGNLTIALWFLSAVMISALFISAAAQGELTSGHIQLAIAMLVLATFGTIAVWRGNYGGTQEEKTKRSRVDSLLNDLSDDDLLELKQRLSDVDGEPSVHTIGDDGELRRSR
jgi:hypothetical protein